MEDKFQNVLNELFDLGIINNSGDPRYIEKVKEMAKKGHYVYHIIDGIYNLGWSEQVHMVSYCFISEDDLDNLEDFWLDLKDGYAFANVVNDTWDIEEMGTVAFKISNGYMVRVY